MLNLLRKAGCIRIHYGVESGNPAILNGLKKGITLEQVKEAFKKTKKAGIGTLGYFMIGNPGETRKEVMETIEFACKLNPDYAYFSITTPYPDTELYSMGLERKLITDKWLEFAKSPTKDFIPDFWEEHLTREELYDLIKVAYKKFCFRPSFVFREVVKTKSIKSLVGKVKVGLKVAK
jgi:radical SAM superfamily enzyme YgiQ (UPF0313 family)